MLDTPLVHHHTLVSASTDGCGSLGWPGDAGGRQRCTAIRGDSSLVSGSATSQYDCAAVEVALLLMSCTRMVQYLQLVHLDSAEVDLVVRADPGVRPHGAR